MIGPADGIAAVISSPALETDLTLTVGRLTNHADNHASTAMIVNETCFQDTGIRSITPFPPRKRQQSVMDPPVDLRQAGYDRELLILANLKAR